MTDWIDWRGGECPVPRGTRIDVMFRDGTSCGRVAPGGSWRHDGGADDVVGYRRIENPIPTGYVPRTERTHPGPITMAETPEQAAQADHTRGKAIDDMTRCSGLGPQIGETTCSMALRLQGKPYPRTCRACGLGPCPCPPSTAEVHTAKMEQLAPVLDRLLDPDPPMSTFKGMGHLFTPGPQPGSEQPDPKPNAQPPVWPLVMVDMAARDNLGRKRYGTALQPFNGRDNLRDAYEEALDLAVYLRTAIYERDGK